MTIKFFLRLTAVTTFLIGGALLIAPGFVANIFLPTNIQSGTIFIRFLGSALMGYSYLNWATVRYNNLDFMHATVIGNLSTLIIAFVLSVIAVINGSLNHSGWLIVLLHATFAAGFTYYFFQTLPKPHAKH